MGECSSGTTSALPPDLAFIPTSGEHGHQHLETMLRAQLLSPSPRSRSPWRCGSQRAARPAVQGRSPGPSHLHLLNCGPCWPVPAPPAWLRVLSRWGLERPLDCPSPDHQPLPPPRRSERLLAPPLAALFCVLSSPTLDFYLLLDALLHSPLPGTKGAGAVGSEGRRVGGTGPRVPHGSTPVCGAPSRCEL